MQIGKVLFTLVSATVALAAPYESKPFGEQESKLPAKAHIEATGPGANTNAA